MSKDKTPTTYTVTVPPGKGGARIDRVLADALGDLSRSRLKALIEAGRVRSEGPGGAAVTEASAKVRGGQLIVVEVPAPVADWPQAQAIALDIVYEDDDVIVIDKPAGLVVHPAPGNPDRTLVNALLGHFAGKGEGGLAGIGGVERPGIVHRLDKDTSGLMVVAKSERAHHSLSRQFAERTVERAYLAVVWGVPMPRHGEIEGNIGRSPANRKKMAVVKRGGKPALTRYKVLENFAGKASLVECRLATGRTHQIRVHLAAIGHPLIGDPLYGRRATSSRKDAQDAALLAAVAALGRQALHAATLGFSVGEGPNKYRYDSKLPNDIKDLLEKLRTL